MKNKVLGAAVISAMIASTAAPAFAGNLASPAIEDELIVIEDAPAGSVSPGLVIGGLVGLALIAAAISSSDDT